MRFLIDANLSPRLASLLSSEGHDAVAVRQLSAHIHPDDTASKAVAAKLGLYPTGELDDEGEMIWK